MSAGVFSDLKDAGNALLKAGDLEGAVAKYTEALGAAGADGEASAIALSNRSLTLLRMGRATEALADAQRCVREDPDYAKGEYRVQKAKEAVMKQAQKAAASKKRPAAAAAAAAGAPASSPPPAPAPAPKAAAPALLGHAKLKADGNALYVKGQYVAAEGLYGQAVEAAKAESDPPPPVLATYYGNRSSARMMLARYAKCADDCAAGLALGAATPAAAKKLRLRHASALGAQGKLDAAVATLHEGATAAGNADPKADAEVRALLATIETIRDFVARGDGLLVVAADGSNPKPDHAAALRAFTRASEAAVCKLGGVSAADAAAQGRAECGWVSLAVRRGRCQAALGQHVACGRAMQRLIDAAPHALEAYEVRAEAFYGQGRSDQAIKYLQHVLRSDPDCSRAARRLKAMKKIIAETKRVREGIAAAVARRDHAAAAALCAEGLELAPEDVDAKVWYSLRRSRARQLLARLESRKASPEGTAAAKELMRGSLRDAGVVTYHDERNAEGFTLKASALQAMGLHEQAVEELEGAAKRLQASPRDPDTRPILEALEKAKFELRKSKRLDIYALLDITEMATEKQIDRAYKKAALKYHPDRFSNKPEEERKAAEEKFKVLGDAVEIMKDAYSKSMYDDGHDLEHIREKAQQREAQQAHRGGGGGHGHGHGRGGFPGGFPGGFGGF